ncbi:MAG TPA: AAA family ATPase [Elusimicrobiota bacterium]|nr:AAA family ATPase [Elusimicrobiota bacterium]
MYEAYWGLTIKPFENTPDPRFLYNDPQHEEALSRLLYVVREGKGAGMLTGVYGCGKTLLGRTLLRELEKDVYRVAYITNPRLDDVELLRMVAHGLGLPDLPTRKADVLVALEKIFDENLRDGRRTVVVVDEAHAIEDVRLFEELRLLLNFQTEEKFLVTLFLLGQPELQPKVDSNKQLAQRLAMRYQLDPLGAAHVRGYIEHRMQVAGSARPVFTPEAVHVIFERSGGIPRRINHICDVSLLTGYSKNAAAVDRDIAREAIESLGGAG